MVLISWRRLLFSIKLRQRVFFGPKSANLHCNLVGQLSRHYRLQRKIWCLFYHFFLCTFTAEHECIHSSLHLPTNQSFLQWKTKPRETRLVLSFITKSKLSPFLSKSFLRFSKPLKWTGCTYDSTSQTYGAILK